MSTLLICEELMFEIFEKDDANHDPLLDFDFEAGVLRRYVPGEEALALSDNTSVPFDAPNVIVIAEVEVTKWCPMDVAGAPPPERKAVYGGRRKHSHGGAVCTITPRQIGR